MNRLQQTGVLAVTLALAVTIPAAAAHGGEQRFQRVSTTPVHLNSSAAEHTAAEIAAATPDGRTVVYTDSPAERIGFAELDDRGGLVPEGVLPMPGEPTSVDIRDGLALVAVNTSESFTAPSGVLQVVDLASRQVVATHDLGGQPDSIDISPDGRYAAIAVENERDEDVNGGALPQLPAGFLAVVDLVGEPSDWSLRRISLTGLAEVAPEDPEPEYVSINSRNEVAVTLQENNHVVVADLVGGAVRGHFSAGVATVDGVDVVEDGRIDPSGSVTAPREPDAIGWLDDTTLATADEGDYRGGSRTWTVFDARSGRVVFSSGADLENLAISQGQYPEGRAENKGVEPEGLAIATYGEHRYAFVGMERANLVAVYNVDEPRKPKLVQGLPTGVGPEGLLPIPARDALVVSAEEDSAADNVRSSLSRYQLTSEPLASSLQRNEGAPSITSRGIGFGALSGLSADGRYLAAVTDDAYAPSRILTVDVARAPATVLREKAVIKDGQPVSYDVEGIAATKGGYWLAVEGNGKDKPNLLVRTDDRGRVQQEVLYPVANATSNGFEGVAVLGDHVWVAVQRGWPDDQPGRTTLARYTPSTGTWAFAAYPLDAAPAGGWVGLSELTALDDGSLLVLERDNRRGEQAQVKRVYKVDTSGLVPAPAGAGKPVVAKQQYRDLLPALRAGGGVVADKPEGLAVFRGELFAAVDNDGLEDAPGESVLLRLGR